MKKIFLFLFAVMTLLTSCQDGHADKICTFIQTATEKTEKATSLQEINKISERLYINICYYSKSLTNEEMKKMDADKEAQEKINACKDRYNEVRDKRILELTPKNSVKPQKKSEKKAADDSTAVKA